MDCNVVILIIITISFQSLAVECCSPTEWQCNDGQCIASYGRCDNFPDCNDGSDENGCTGAMCPEGDKKCVDVHGTETCIGPNKKCDCGPPLQIPNGNITASNTLDGATASVYCDEGYIPSDSTVICPETGLWSDASCIAKDCGQLPPLQEGKLTLTDPNNSKFGASAMVQCSVGFETSAALIFCLSTGKWGIVTCTIIDCGQLPLIPYGNATLAVPEKTTYESDALVVCASGYDPNVSTVTCLASGQWEIAKCEPVDCGQLPPLDEGTITLADPNNSKFGASAIVQCNVGFETSAALIFCLSTGKWVTVTCTIIDCGQLPLIPYGNATLAVPEKTTYGSDALVVCALGYEPNVSTVTCLASGQWEVAKCEPVDCGSLAFIPYGNSILAVPEKTIYGSKAHVFCNLGYEPTVSTIMCLASGHWDVITCEAVDCGHLTLIPHGYATLTVPEKTKYGSEALVVCAVGYETNVSTITCLASGEWEEAVCQAVDCGPLNLIPRGNATLAVPEKTTYGSEALVVCRVGYETNVSTITCLASGEWEESVCQAIDCGLLPVIPYGNTTLAVPEKSTFESYAHVVCSLGYESDRSTITCLASGHWEEAVCEAVDCGPLSFITFGNATLVVPEKTTYGSEAQVFCSLGYQPDRTKVTCLATGHWEEVMCEALDCGKLPFIPFGNSTLAVPEKTIYGSDAHVVCSLGYESNVSTITCLGSGQWEEATCEAVDCGLLPFIPFGNSTLVVPKKTTYGSDAHVVCSLGYEPNVSTITCLGSGQWEEATCEAVDCGPIPLIPYGNAALAIPKKTTYTAKGQVVCGLGYKPNVSTIACLSSGQWEVATCKAVDCGQLPSLSNGMLTLTDPGYTTFRSTAKVNCRSGFKSSTSQVTCLFTGNWGTATCTPIDCGSLPLIPHGNATLTVPDKTSYGSEAHIVCSMGFELHVSTITCLASGHWEAAMCRAVVVVPPKEDSNLKIVVIVLTTIAGLALLLLLQLVFSAVLHCIIYNKYTESGDKVCQYLVLSAIPIFGIYKIVNRWKALKFRKYRVAERTKNQPRTSETKI